jgi:hypothetical protein
MINRGTYIQWVQPIRCEDGETVERNCVHQALAFSFDGKRVAFNQVQPTTERLKILIYETSELDRLLSEASAQVVQLKRATRPVTIAVEKYREKVRDNLVPLLGDTEWLFDRNLRADAVRDIIAKTNYSEKRVRKMMKNLADASLAYAHVYPNWHACGTPKSGHRVITAKKLGRPDRFAEHRGLITGRVLTNEDKEKFEKGLSSFYWGYSKAMFSRKRAWRLTLLFYYRKLVQVSRGNYVTVSEKNLPTLKQFKDYIRSNYTPEQIEKKRQSAAQFGTGNRKRQSESESLVPMGPGDIYQIDSTIADIYLVAADGSRKVIGRPTLYLVIDVFSKMIVGFHLSLRSSCYEEMVCALLSVIEDKRELFKRWGIEDAYDPKDWPEMPLPTVLIGDRQELIYGNSDLVYDLGIEIVNTPPYRGDLKDAIESAIGGVSRHLWRRPGAVTKDCPMDLPENYKDAVYTFKNLGGLILKDIIQLNNRHLVNTPVPEEYTAYSEDKRPVAIAAWGQHYISGCGFALGYEEAQRELLPYADSASVTRDGLRVTAAGAKDIYYHIPKDSLPKHITGSITRKPVRVQFDSRRLNVVWVRHPETNEMVECHLKVRTFREYANWSWAQSAHWQNRLAIKGIKIEEENLEREFKFMLAEAEAAADGFNHAVSQDPVTRVSIKAGMTAGRAVEHQKHLDDRPAVVTGDTTPDLEERL